MLNSQTELSRSIPDKWHGELPSTFKPNWREVWLSERQRKDAGFSWSIYDAATVVNVWCHKLLPDVSELCPCCDARLPESQLHCSLFLFKHKMADST